MSDISSALQSLISFLPAIEQDATRSNLTSLFLDQVFVTLPLEEQYQLLFSLQPLQAALPHCERCTCADNDDCPCYRECDHYSGTKYDLDAELEEMAAAAQAHRAKKLVPSSQEIIMLDLIEDKFPSDSEEDGISYPKKRSEDEEEEQPSHKKVTRYEEEKKPKKHSEEEEEEQPSHKKVTRYEEEDEEPEPKKRSKEIVKKSSRTVSAMYHKFLFSSIRATFSREQLLDLLEQIHEDQPITSSLEQAMEDHCPTSGLEVRLPQGVVYLPLEQSKQDTLWGYLKQVGSLTVEPDQLHEGGPMVLSCCNIIKHADLNPDLFEQGVPELRRKVVTAITDIILDQEETILFDS